MAELLLVTVCRDPAGLAAVCTGSVLVVQVGIGWGLDHRAEIAGSWADGREWLLALAVSVDRRARAVGLWLLVHVVLRAKGRHRAVSA